MHCAAPENALVAFLVAFRPSSIIPLRPASYLTCCGCFLFFVVSFFGAFLFVGWLSSGYVLKQQAAEGEGGYREQQCFATGANLSIQRWRTGQRKQW